MEKCICNKEFDKEKGLKAHQRTCEEFQGIAVFPKGAKIEQKIHEPHILNVMGRKVVV